MSDVFFVTAARTDEEVKSLRDQLKGRNLSVSMRAPSIFTAYESGRITWEGQRRIVYVHSDVVFLDLLKFMEQVQSLPPGTHGVVGTNDPAALDISPWWEREDRHGKWKQNFPDGTPERVFAMGTPDRPMPVRMLDGVILVTVDQEWDWKIPDDLKLWHGYDWLACKRTLESGGQCFTLAQPEDPILLHYGWGRMDGFFEAMKTLRECLK